MTVPQRNANVVALFPLQETIWDKDGTGALAAGVVSFFSDPLFSVPKDVYQETDNPVTGTVTYTNLGNVLILSSIGSFVDGNGENFIPMLYPYEGSPDDEVAGDFEPYYITVYSSSGVFQFSTNDWPPNSFSQSGSSSGQEALTPNLITNPQFSIVSFTPAPSTGTYVYTVSGTASNPLAPGWVLNTVGSGTVTVSQVSLNSSIPSESPYALQILWSTGLTSLQIVQQLTNSPRILADGNGCASLVVSSPTGNTINVQLRYVTPDPIDILLAEGNTQGTNTFTTIVGTEPIPATSTQSASGYVNFVIDIESLNSSASLQLTSAQLVGVDTASTMAAYIQQTTQENLNNLMWYYQPQLVYKPIPSYTIGWDFPYNPCQALGPSVAVSGLGNNLSRYIADQTIAFEAVGNVLSYLFNAPSGLTISATGSPSQFCIIQYLDAVTAALLLQGNMAVKISNAYGFPDSLTGYVNLYYTQDASLPNINSGTNLSLVATMTDGQPATFNGTWIKVPRSGLGDAVFNAANGFNEDSFSGWNATSISSSSTPTFFAIVISFTALAASTAASVRYCTLSKGDISTTPPATNKGETLNALQFYYQKSYELADLPGTASTYEGVISTPFIALPPGGGGTSSFIQTFCTAYALKRATPTVTYYSPETGTASVIRSVLYVNGAVVQTAEVNTASFTPVFGTTGTLMSSSSAGASAHDAGTTVPYFAVGLYQYVSDARFGIV